MFDPNDPNRIILAGDSNYSYKLLLVSSDRGVTWNHTGNGLLGPVYCLAAVSSVSGLFFAGTGQGLFLTRDGGNNWTRTGTFSSVRAVCIHPENESIIYAGTDNGVYLTTDGGTNWQQINEGLTSLRILSLAFRAGENATVFAGTNGAGIFAASPPTGITQRRSAEPLARRVTPNPSRGIVEFTLASSKAQIFCFIYDRSGRLLLSPIPQRTLNTNRWQLDLRSLSAGTYFLEIKETNRAVFYPLVITK